MSTAEYLRKSAEARLRASGKPFIECLECGVALRIIGTHLLRVHDMDAREYLLKHRLPEGTRLAAPDLVQLMREKLEADPQRKAKMRDYSHSEENRLRLATQDWGAVGEKIRESKAHRLTDSQRDAMTKRIKSVDPTYALERRIERDFALGRTLWRTCLQCKKEYITKRSTNLFFCSIEHMWEWNRKNRPDWERHPNLVASRRRSREAGQKRRTRTCSVCGTKFTMNKAFYAGFCCSAECRSIVRDRDDYGRFA